MANYDDDDPEWLPDEAVEALNTERTLTQETAPEMTRRLFRDNAPGAATSIVHVALYGSNERLRLDASKYVVDRVLGRVGEDVIPDKDSPLEAMMKNMMQAAEAHANQE
jgi:hypothetical protein